MSKKLSLITAVVIISYLAHFIGIFNKSEEYQKKYSDCKYLEGDNFGLYGTEDSVVYNDDILIGISTGIHKIFTTDIDVNSLERGSFFAIYGLSTGNFKVKKVQVDNLPEKLFFNPHGVSLRNSHLYVINHSYHTGGERVETYKVTINEEGQVVLTYLHATAISPDLNGVTNDIEFLSDDRFLITQWQMFAIPLRGNSEQSLWKKVATLFSQIFYQKYTYAYDCKYAKNNYAKCDLIESSSGVAVNGVAYDGDKTIAISDTISKNTKFYQLNDKQELLLVDTLQNSFMVDNVNYDSRTKQFIFAGSNSIYEYLLANNKLSQVLSNKTNKSVVSYSAQVEGVRYNSQKKTFESELIFSSNQAVFTISGALFDYTQKYLFLNNFSDKSIAVCSRN